MKKPVIVLLFIAVSIVLLLVTAVKPPSRQHDQLAVLKDKYSDKHTASVDHSKLKALQGDFAHPGDVTEACISCHTERHKEVMQSSHYTWEREAYIPGRGITYAGKKNLLNNFCIGIGGSEMACTKCHSGYGWKDAGFDFEDHRNVDCPVCHDQSLGYAKASGKAGYPLESVDLGESARSAGIPSKANCGSCHFYGGGGNNVKHGDLEEAILESNRNVDVHMGLDGINLGCVDCHQTEKHNITGQLYAVSSMNKDRVTCDQCHTNAPHEENILNEHTLKVACQTCHIPVYAKVNATKMSWDWSTAGRLENGEPFHEEDEDGNHTYLSIKGSFEWEKNVQPEYTWFNGTADHYFIGDKVDTSQVIKMNTLFGEYRDPDSKIIPTKIHRAKQIYDCENQVVIQPKLFSENKGGGGYWKDFDWHVAAEMGMASVNEPYSGNFCFVNTEMYWPVNHMVSPKEEALDCTECHTRENGRLAALTDFYMPGRDSQPFVEFAGTWLIFLSLIGVVIHLSVRLIISSLNKSGGK